MAAIQKLKHIVKSAGILPQHPYSEQFTPAMDLTSQDRTKNIYMIASTPRCGSHFLAHCLLETGALGVPLEYTNPGHAYYWKRRFGTLDVAELFPHFLRHRTSANGWFGFKAHWSRFAPYKDRMTQMTQGVGIGHIIRIQRRDLVAQAISHVVARQTGVWISGAKARGTAQYAYDEIVKSAKDIAGQNAQWDAYLPGFDGKVMNVQFEDLRDDPADIFDRIRSFLDVDAPFKLPERTKKQSGQASQAWKQMFLSELRPEDQWIAEAAERPAWQDRTAQDASTIDVAA